MRHLLERALARTQDPLARADIEAALVGVTFVNQAGAAIAGHTGHHRIDPLSGRPWLPALAQAITTPGSYFADVGPLGHVRFNLAEDLGNGMVRLFPCRGPDDHDLMARLPCKFATGVDVYVADIRAAARDVDGAVAQVAAKAA